MPHLTTPIPFLRRCCLLALFLLCVPGLVAAAEEPRTKGLFLVATEQLDGTSFQQTVILLTHFSPHGAVGLAINRPSDIALHEVFPEFGQLKQGMDLLFLGGPISANVLSILVRTSHPTETMRHIADNIYLASAQIALAQAIDGAAHIYAGYTGWAPGQLQAEIERGDWMVVQDDPQIIFEENTAGLWQNLYRSWSGEWI